MRLYSTANERGFALKRLFVCLAAKCRRDARDPLVSPVFQDRKHFAWCFFRFAGETPAILWSVNRFKNDPLITART
ncbi:MAG: hypothetical protein LBP59_07210 [Planctomycetaceae bacterium]|nr:hypothetical protein [Planctomycetaceae bacterium]